ncbi:MAG: CotH kinase family protein [Christensenellales bacterium]
MLLNGKRLMIIVSCLLILVLGTGAVILFEGYFIGYSPINSLAFIVRNKEMDETINIWHEPSDGNYYVFLPSHARLQDVSIKGLPISSSLTINGNRYHQTQTLSNLSPNVKYPIKILNLNGTVADVGTIIFMQSANIASMFIATQSGGMDRVHASKNNKERGQATLFTHEGTVDYSGEMKHIKGRGNSTWRLAKKPYFIQLNSAQNLLGMGLSKNWILLANYIDRSYIRSKLAYSFAQKIGLAQTPNSEFCDLYINGEYYGLYQLTEKAETGTSGIDIPLATQDRISGGYLFEISRLNRFNDSIDVGFLTSQDILVLVSEPSAVNKQQLDYVHNLVQEAEDALYPAEDPGKPYHEYFDMDSWVKTYLVHEIFENQDAGGVSTFFYTNGNDARIYSGPLWDFDLCLGNGYASVRNPSVFSVNTKKTWYNALYKKEEFREEATRQYEQLCLPILNQYLEEEIEALARQISASASMDTVRWISYGKSAWSYESQLSYGEQIAYLQTFLSQRVVFLNSAWLDGIDYCRIQIFLGDEQPDYERWRSYSVKPGETFEIPIIPERTNASFAGWYYANTDTPYDPNIPVTKNISVWARWKSIQEDNITEAVAAAIQPDNTAADDSVSGSMDDDNIAEAVAVMRPGNIAAGSSVSASMKRLQRILSAIEKNTLLFCMLIAFGFSAIWMLVADIRRHWLPYKRKVKENISSSRDRNSEGIPDHE